MDLFIIEQALTKALQRKEDGSRVIEKELNQFTHSFSEEERVAHKDLLELLFYVRTHENIKEVLPLVYKGIEDTIITLTGEEFMKFLLEVKLVYLIKQVQSGEGLN